MNRSALVSAVGFCLLLPGCGKEASHGPGRSPDDAALPIECSSATSDESALLVDDFEDGDLVLDRKRNLRGVWYVNNDGTGAQAPQPGDESEGLVDSPGSPDSPEHALHTSGAAFTRWGAFAAARLNASRSGACSYDLSRYTGMRLSIKGEGSLRVNLGAVPTTPVVDGGTCSTDACSDYGKSLELTSDWQSQDVSFAELEQPAWATPAPLELESALRVSFWAERGDFEFWVDDLRFYR